MFGIDIRIVEEAHLKFPEKHRSDELIELRFFENAFFHQFDQIQIAIRVGQLDVDAGVDRKRAGFLLVLRDEVAMRVGAVAELPDRVVVGDNEAFEAHLLAKHVAEQPPVRVRRDTVDFVVRSHDGDRAGFPQSFLKRVEEGFAQNAQGDVRRGAVHAGFRLAVPDEMLERGENVALIAEIAVSLESTDSGNPEAGNQVRVLAVGFFNAAPAWLAGDVDDGRERVVRAAQSGFESRHGEERLDQLGIEGCAQSDGLREAGAFGGCVAVETFLVKHDGNAEARVFDKELLNGVGQLRHASRGFAAARVAGAPDLADTTAIAEGFFRFGLIEVALLVDELLGLLLPDARHLRSLLFQRHAGEEIFYAARGRQARILIGRGNGTSGLLNGGLLLHEDHS